MNVTSNEQKNAESAQQAAFRTLFFNKSWFANFLSNVLGVIVGIVLTFGATYLIQRHNEKNEIRTMMALMKKEINDNKNMFLKMSEDFRQTKEAYSMFLSSRWKTMPNDSLEQYISNARGGTVYTMPSVAWKVFQNSDIIKNFDDKSMIVAFSVLYNTLEELHKWWNKYTEEKMEAVIWHNAPNFAAGIEEILKTEQARLFMEDIATEVSYTFETPFASTIDFADYILYLIDKSGDYQADITDLDEDFEKYKRNKK